MVDPMLNERLSPHVPDLESLEILVDIASSGSLGRTAVARGVSQPAISGRIRRMEQLVGVGLVARGARGSRPTEAGALVVEWAREVLSAAATLDAGISSLRTSRDERLQVAASLTIAEQLLPRWLVQFAAQSPATSVSLTAVNSADVVAAVQSGKVDLGFVEGPILPGGLDGQIVARDDLVLIVPPAHPWVRRRRPVAAEELAATRLVHREQRSGTRDAFEAAMRPYLPLAAPLLELSTSTGVRAAVAAGAGPAVLSELSVRDDVSAGRVAMVAVDGVDLSRRLRAVWPRGQRPAGPARDLLAIALRRS